MRLWRWARGRARNGHEVWRRSRSQRFVIPSVGSFVHGHTSENAAEISQRVADVDPAFVETELPDGALMLAAALLHDRNGLADRAFGFEVAQEHHGVREIAGVHRRIHLTAD